VVSRKVDKDFRSYLLSIYVPLYLPLAIAVTFRSLEINPRVGDGLTNLYCNGVCPTLTKTISKYIFFMRIFLVNNGI